MVNRRQTQPSVPSNTGMQRTALRARKIGAFLNAGIGSTAYSIYRCAAADAQTVGRHINLVHDDMLLYLIDAQRRSRL